MSCIVYQTNKKTGVTYAYESVSYWDKEKQQPRSKRQYIGRVDDETGEIIYKKDKKSADTATQDNTDTSALLVEQEKLLAALKAENKELRKELSDAKKIISKIRSLCEEK